MNRNINLTLVGLSLMDFRMPIFNPPALVFFWTFPSLTLSLSRPAGGLVLELCEAVLTGLRRGLLSTCYGSAHRQVRVIATDTLLLTSFLA